MVRSFIIMPIKKHSDLILVDYIFNNYVDLMVLTGVRVILPAIIK